MSSLERLNQIASRLSPEALDELLVFAEHRADGRECLLITEEEMDRIDNADAEAALREVDLEGTVSSEEARLQLGLK